MENNKNILHYQPDTPTRNRFSVFKFLVISVALSLGAIALYTIDATYQRERLKPLQKQQCAEWLKQTWQGLNWYAQRHNGRFPDSFRDLDPNMPDQYQLVGTPHDAGYQNRKYIYIGGGAMLQSPPDRVIIYENLSEHDGEGIHVLMSNGEIKWLDAQAATRLLKQLRRD